MKTIPRNHTKVIRKLLGCMFNVKYHDRDKGYHPEPIDTEDLKRVIRDWIDDSKKDQFPPSTKLRIVKPPLHWDGDDGTFGASWLGWYSFKYVTAKEWEEYKMGIWQTWTDLLNRRRLFGDYAENHNQTPILHKES